MLREPALLQAVPSSKESDWLPALRLSHEDATNFHGAGCGHRCYGRSRLDSFLVAALAVLLLRRPSVGLRHAPCRRIRSHGFGDYHPCERDSSGDGMAERSRTAVDARQSASHSVWSRSAVLCGGRGRSPLLRLMRRPSQAARHTFTPADMTSNRRSIFGDRVLLGHGLHFEELRKRKSRFTTSHFGAHWTLLL